MENKKTIRFGFTKKIVLMTFIIGLTISACVSLKTPVRTDLAILKPKMLIGKYPVRVNRTFRKNSQRDTIISMPLWHFFKSSESTDSSELAKATHMELTLTDDTHVTSALYKDAQLLKTDVIKGRMKDGYFRKKHNLSITGIPPFYWAMTSNKMQFGLGKERQLYIDQADETNGSILIIVAGTPGFTTSITVPPYFR